MNQVDWVIESFRASPAAPPPPAQLLSSKGQPVYLPNLQHNNKALYYVKSSTACISGATAGILGLTNTTGFAFFFVTALSTGILFASFNCRGKPEKFYLTKREPVLSGLAENLFSYVLFWTRKFLRSYFSRSQYLRTYSGCSPLSDSFLLFSLYLRLIEHPNLSLDSLSVICIHYAHELLPSTVPTKESIREGDYRKIESEYI